MRKEDRVALGTTFIIFTTISLAVASFSNFISSELSCIEHCKISLQACTVKTCIRTQEKKAPKKMVKKTVKKKEEIVKKEIKPLDKASKLLAKKEPVKEIFKEEKPVEKTKEEITEPAQQAVAKTMDAQQKNQVVSAALMDARSRFFQKIKEEINSNKRYPRIALRRSIEGEVKIHFTIFSDGSIKINALEGDKFFHNNSQEALLDTFPISIPQELELTFPLDLSVDLKYQLS